jgi:truncated hemoglobin YjbI
MRKCTTVFCVAVIVAIGSLATAAPPQQSSGKSLYQRLGGKKGVQSVVNDFAARCAADQRINSYFAATVADPKRLAGFKQKLAVARQGHFDKLGTFSSSWIK